MHASNVSECIGSVHTLLLDLALHAALSRHLIGSNGTDAADKLEVLKCFPRAV